MAAKKDYWFKTKKYGWGWGLPLTWQGWASFGIFILIWILALFAYLPSGSEGLSSENLWSFIGVMVVDVLALVYVSFAYGEPPSWNAGSKKSAKRKAAPKKAAAKTASKRKKR